MKNSPPMPSLVIITMPHSRVLKLISRSVLLSLLIVLFPWIGSFAPNSNQFEIVSNSSYLPLLFQDLFNQAIFKSGDQALFVGVRDDDEVTVYGTPRLVLHDTQIDLILEPFRETSIPEDGFDFVITSGCCVPEFIGRSLKVGGVLVVELDAHPLQSKTFKIPSNYKIVYVRRFHATIVAVRKLSSTPKDKSMHDSILNSIGKRRLLADFESQPKRTAAATLDGLEDVMLEPPRRSSSDYLRKIKYLPDLTGDLLDRYPRRVFIDVALPGNNGGSSSIEWFRNNYPTRNTEFDFYNIEMVPTEESALVSHPGVSEWLWRNVKEEEYVVMKAEADAVEDMLSSGAISLVDELFLECNHQWQRGRKNMGSDRRAYWECLALYGRVRDEGIAVHQWWE